MKKPKRAFDTVILPGGQAEMLLADTREFLASEGWYRTTGVPYRRGYLLHGRPGTGKSQSQPIQYVTTTKMPHRLDDPCTGKRIIYTHLHTFAHNGRVRVISS